ncbi:MAG TPA: pentapeptide repeat-containing protein [Phormidium sp.]
MNRLKTKLKEGYKWLKTPWNLLVLSAITFLLIFAIFLYLSPKWQWADWTGFGEDLTISQEETLQNGKLTVTKRITQFQSGKTLWDWLGLAGVIAIPVVLFQFQQQQQKKSEEQAEVEKEIAATILREEALQKYIDKIAELLIDKKLKLLLKDLSDETITKDNPKLDALLDVARARTSSILRRLDGDKERKVSVFLFLVEAELIKDLDLLKRANLSGINLSGANFSGADISRINLSEANVVLAHFNGADLSGANLSGANLVAASFSEAQLFGANFDGANLDGADLKFAKGLFPEQIQAAINWEKAKYSSDLRTQLGLPPENTP